MDKRLGQNTQAISLGLGLLGGIAWAATRDDAVLGAALLLLVIGLMGDRLKKAPGGWEFSDVSHRVSEQVLAALPPPEAVTGAGDVTIQTTSEGVGTVTRSAEDSVGPIAEEVSASVIRSGRFTADAVIAAAGAMKHAATPEELADRVAEYVRLRANTLPVPESFRVLGMKAQLTGDDNPCRVCEPLRGNLYDPNDPDAPRLPIAGCQHERGCSCRYLPVPGQLESPDRRAHAKAPK
jgi:hypothetical protein